jgi:hypothetical protein
VSVFERDHLLLDTGAERGLFFDFADHPQRHAPESGDVRLGEFALLEELRLLRVDAHLLKRDALLEHRDAVRVLEAAVHLFPVGFHSSRAVESDLLVRRQDAAWARVVRKETRRVLLRRQPTADRFARQERLRQTVQAVPGHAAHMHDFRAIERARLACGQRVDVVQLAVRTAEPAHVCRVERPQLDRDTATIAYDVEEAIAAQLLMPDDALEELLARHLGIGLSVERAVQREVCGSLPAARLQPPIEVQRQRCDGLGNEAYAHQHRGQLER